MNKRDVCPVELITVDKNEDWKDPVVLLSN